MVALGIVDDEPDILSLFRIMLRQSGYPIAYVASNGAEAMEKHRAAPAGIVFMDYNMPYKDGVETAREILSEFPGTKIFLMTCGEDILERVKGISDIVILKKPFRFKNIVEMLDRLVLRNEAA
jgi:DNA-binding response OmpR family regulator